MTIKKKVILSIIILVSVIGTFYQAFSCNSTVELDKEETETAGRYHYQKDIEEEI